MLKIKKISRNTNEEVLDRIREKELSGKICGGKWSDDRAHFETRGYRRW